MTILHLYPLPSEVPPPTLKKTFPPYSAVWPPFFHRRPPNSSSTETMSSSGPSADMIAGIKNDLAEIQGFKSGLSLFSSKFTSNLLQFLREMNDTDDDDDDEDLDEENDGIVGNGNH
ncbi:Uncharacterized protein Adt_04284 [Abeliophyllum distichum]|uniref:Uncharacterized protein n=1 Tax=Abeliophyllum distichum TaxID=126358 RepID=A0ABD1W1C8_9LAMI